MGGMILLVHQRGTTTYWNFSTKENIADIMYIPLIQGTLHNAYQVQYQGGEEKDKAEGASFAAAVLPRVHAANKDAAAKIYNNMRVGAYSTSYEAVQDAFKSVYTDLNIDCVQIGGVWDKSAGAYHKNAGPCMESNTQSKTENETQRSSKNKKRDQTGAILSGIFAFIGCVAFLGSVYCFYRKRDMRDHSFSAV